MASSEICNAVDKAAQKFEEMGCIVHEIQMTPLYDWSSCGTLIMTAEAYAIHEHNLRTRFTDYGEIFRDRLALAGLFTAADYIHATQRRREFIDELDKAMMNLDMIITATAATCARNFDAPVKFSIYEKPLLTIPFNVTGNPAISVCCGYSEIGLPLGLQIIGKRFDESTVLTLAHAYEQATPWHEKHPSLVF